MLHLLLYLVILSIIVQQLTTRAHLETVTLSPEPTVKPQHQISASAARRMMLHLLELQHAPAKVCLLKL